MAQTGSFKQAEEALLLVQSEKYKAEYCYISWLARCYISNGQPRNVRQTKEQNRNEHARGRKRMRKDERRKGKRKKEEKQNEAYAVCLHVILFFQFFLVQFAVVGSNALTNNKLTFSYNSTVCLSDCLSV